MKLQASPSVTYMAYREGSVRLKKGFCMFQGFDVRIKEFQWRFSEIGSKSSVKI